MDKQSDLPPPEEGSEQLSSLAAANPPSNLPFGGSANVLDQTAIPQIINPYAAAAAAIALAHQQMAQSLQANAMGLSQQPNGAFIQPIGTNPSAQMSQAPSDAPPTNSSASISSHGSTNNASNQNVAQAGAPNAAQNFPLSFQTQTPLAALFAGGWLSTGITNQAPPVTSMGQQNNVQQQQANNNVFHKATIALKAPVPKAAPTPTEAGAPQTSAAVAAAQVVAAHAAAASSGAMASAVFANMQNWRLDQLESHVQLLRDTNQPIPQPVAILLADARRKEEKRTAKRAANRRSACSSRARKKALVEEMTKANARLRRQAMILALLPDLVIAITVDGKITFCSAQVERVLRHKITHLVGADFSDILIPSSRVKLQELVEELLAAEQVASLAAEIVAGPPKLDDAEMGQSSGKELSSGGEVNPVSEGSFPLSVVNVANEPNSAEDNTDLSASNGGGKTFEGAAQNGPNPKEGRSFDESGNATQVKSDVSAGSGLAKRRSHIQESSDDSFSTSNDAKNLLKANEALDRNVRWHNEMLVNEGKVPKKTSSHKDDVTGAYVTANNASARLSSLQVRADPSSAEEPTRKRKASRYDSLEDQSSSSSSDSIIDNKSRKSGIENASEDSGYRESNQSEEDTFDDSSSLRNGPRFKPLAPARNICLIRNDLTTIWCEVTSSIRTRSSDDEGVDEQTQMGPLEARIVSSKASLSLDVSDEDPSSKGDTKELLLCLRPIRDGEETVDESLRFIPPKNVKCSGSAGAAGGPLSSSANFEMEDTAKRLPKKRRFVSEQSSSSLSNESMLKKRQTGTVKSVVELLMLMGNNAK